MEKFRIKSLCVLIPAVLNNKKEVVCVTKREKQTLGLMAYPQGPTMF